MCVLGFDEDATALHQVEVPTIEIERERSSPKISVLSNECVG